MLVRLGSRALQAIKDPEFKVNYTKNAKLSALDEIKSNRNTKVTVNLDKLSATKALELGVRAGVGVIERLSDLKKILVYVGHESLISSSTSFLTKNASRFSKVNLQAQTEILLKKINKIVMKASIKGANFVSSNSPDIRVQTSAFGGSINIRPQPFDTIGLGISNLNLMTVGGVNDVRGKLDSALIFANKRLTSLESLQRGIGAKTLDQQFLDKVLSNFGSTELPIGTLINFRV